MIYGSVCSGIEAATVAWRPLGWSPAFFAEIEKFPSAVLAHHYGSNMPGDDYTGINGVPNYGDMTQFKDWPDHANIDVLVGGTPCQDFSNAGRGDGLDGARGGLTLKYAEIAQRYRPRWLVWENVPGVFSTNSGDDFGSVLACFAGYPDGSRFETPRDGWKNTGIVPGSNADSYGLAWRVLDAQYVRVDGFVGAVPQRRRRVFIVGYLGDWRRAAAVLFEPEGLRRDTPPRREARQGIARAFEIGPAGDNETDVAPTLDTRCKDGPVRNQLAAAVMVPDVSLCLNAGGMGRQDAETETLVTHPLLGKGNDSHDPTLETYIPVGYSIMPMNSGKDFKARETEVAQPLMAGQAGGNQGGDYVVQPIAFSCKDYGNDASNNVAPTMRSMNSEKSHQNGGGQLAVAYDLRGREGGSQFEGPHDTANIRAASGGLSKSYVAETMAVRRLTPLECGRLQGFPDTYTQIEYRGKAPADCPDGPRYKALGNSMAVNVMRWIGMRIAIADKIETN